MKRRGGSKPSGHHTQRAAKGNLLRAALSVLLSMAFVAQGVPVRAIADEASVYGIVDGSVIQGTDEAYTRLKVVFRNGDGGDALATQIVREGDTIVAPDPTSNEAREIHPDDASIIVDYPTLSSWKANGTAVDTATYFDTELTEQSIQNFISAYGATESAEYDNLYEVDVVATYETGFRAYFHRYSYRSGDDSAAYNGVILGSLATSNKQVDLADFTDRYVPPTENDVLIGWRAYDMDGNQITIGGKDFFTTTDTVTLADDTDFYPVLAEGVTVALDMGGAASLDSVVAVYDAETQYNTLALEDLPNDVVNADGFYPGYAFAGWYTDSAYTNQITEDNPATFAPGTADAKVYAKWTANEEVSYKIAFLVEDETGEPGEGNFSVYTTKTFTGTAGDTIPAANYTDESIPYHHLVNEDEIAGNELYNKSVAETTIEGDGSTVKLVYYTYNRVLLTCTQDRFGNDFSGGNNVLPDKWAKPGESIEDWLGDVGFSNYSAYIYMGENTKNYVEGDGYTFDGTQTAIPYVEAKSDDGTTVTMIAYSGSVISQVKGEHYYECIPGEDYDSTVTVTVNGEEREFYLDHEVAWGSSAQNYQRPDEKFGNTAEGGGLTERAYKAMHFDQDYAVSVRDLPDERIGNPGKINTAYRYDTYYFDHYYVRARGALTFANLDGIQADKPEDQSSVVYGEKLSKYLPDYDEQTERIYDGVTYSFAGWYTDQTAANNPDDDSSAAFKLADDATMPASDLALYAGWRRMSYQVTFDAQGGTFEGGQSTKTESVKSGERVSRPDDPTRTNAADEQPYVFAGWYKDQDCTQKWDFDTDVVHGNTTLYARWYHEKTWTIEYYNADGTQKASWGDRLAEGAIVQLDAPEKSTYDGKPFLGWAIKVGDGDSDSDYLVAPNNFTIVDIEEDHQVVKLYARYGDASLVGAPTVTFHANYPSGADETSDTLAADPEIPNGQVTLPTLDGAGFTCPEHYRFVGWGNTADGSDQVYAAGKPVGVSGEPGENADLYAIYEQLYTVRFLNDDGTELQSEELAAGETPEYTGETPTKEATAQYTYAFAGWDPEITSVTGDATYTATYEATVNEYTVTFKNDDGSVLQSGKVAYGETPEYTGETPTKAADAQYTYAFAGWDPEITSVTGDATYTATYEATVNEYTITFKNDDGTVLQSGKVAYGEAPEYTGETPTKAATAQYTYTFKGWDPEITSVTGDATYTATYEATVNEYTVTFKNDDGSVLQSGKVAYGETPEYTGETPTKAATAQYTYTFKGWDPGITSVTGDATYTATYEATPKKTTTPTSKDSGKSDAAPTSAKVSNSPKTGDPTSLGVVAAVAVFGVALLTGATALRARTKKRG